MTDVVSLINYNKWHDTEIEILRHHAIIVKIA